ncbi:MAG: tRNA (adenosine(37)-N6)-threonylcarbamoyltransferase complex dimerization subunit type 1 TsaB [Erythrobacter sp.]
MRILAIETASEACSVALFEGAPEGALAGARLIAHDHRILGRGHAEALVPMIADLPEKGKAARIVVSLGPGSFTGVRIGLATARALGVAWGADVLGYPTARLVACQPAAQSDPRPVTVCLNGGHGEWFVQSFDADGAPDADIRSLTPGQTAADTVHRVIVGNRARECAALFDDDRLAIDLGPDARHVNLLDETHFTADLRPIYGRAPDAKPQTPFRSGAAAP